jgi:hypothetical protein
MSITTTQLVTLKAAILAETNPAFVALRQAGATGQMSDWINGTLVPNQSAWLSSASSMVLDEGADYSLFDSIVAGKRDAWALFLRYAPRDITRFRNRKVIVDIWGPAIAASVAESILLVATRKITRGEGYLGGIVTATTGTVTALRLVWEGSVSNDDVVQAVNL